MIPPRIDNCLFMTLMFGLNENEKIKSFKSDFVDFILNLKLEMYSIYYTVKHFNLILF